MSLGLHLAKVRLSERKTKYSEFFRAEVPSTDRSKVRISERKAKEKLVFFCTSEREYLGPTGQRYDYASEQQRKSQIFFVSIFATKLQRYFSFHTSSLKSDADIICPEGCCAGRSWWFAGVRWVQVLHSWWFPAQPLHHHLQRLWVVGIVREWLC